VNQVARKNPKSDLFLVDCTKALDAGINKLEIIKRAELYFKESYWQHPSYWDPDYKFLKKKSQSIVGMRLAVGLDYEKHNLIIIPWDSLSELRLEEVVNKTKFNEELL